MDKRHYCTYCGAKKAENKMVQIYYKLLQKKAWHCSDHTSTKADILQIVSNKKSLFLELFSGSKQISEHAAQSGFKVFNIDINPKYSPSLVSDILKVKLTELPKDVSVIWASIPCTVFSILSIAKHWEKVNYAWRQYFYIPKTREARQALRIVEKTLWLIQKLNPTYFFIENPRGAMRHLPQLRAIPFRHTVTYADYGFDYYKPTDIFTNFPGLQLKEIKSIQEFDLGGNIADMSSAYERSLVPTLLVEAILKQVSERMGVAPAQCEKTA